MKNPSNDTASQKPIRSTPFVSLVMQSVTVGVRTAFVEISSHKLRSALSMLGVLLGVASLVAMLTLVGGIDTYLNTKMATWTGSLWFFEQRHPEPSQKIAWGRSPGMKFSDGTQLEDSSTPVKHFYKSIERYGNINILGNTERSRVAGIEFEVLADDTQNITMTDGRILNDIDFENELPVCIISWEIADRIRKKIAMNGTSADKFSFVGKVCTYNQQNFRIVGVFGPRDPDFKPRQLRRCVFIPVGAIQKYMTGDNPDPGTVRLMVKEPKTILDQAKKITKDLISLHRGAEDFEYRTADWLEEMSRMLSNVALLMSIISVISLLVGGMSIMNVMLSSIAERIHEIGVRKALGAKNSQIFIQFLVESITLCLVGGSAGGVVGLAPLLFKEAIKKSTQGAIEPTLLASHLVFVILIVTVVGIVFGLYPAIKAGKMNPVDALRYE